MKKWHAFISHACEDKDQVARPLAEKLREEGVEVWFDEIVLRPGDSLRQAIDEGLTKSQLGLVVLSDSFFAKKWPQRELNALFAMEEEGHQRIIPILHGLSRSEAALLAPLLADKLSLSTADGIDSVVDRILGVVSDLRERPLEENREAEGRASALVKDAEALINAGELESVRQAATEGLKIDRDNIACRMARARTLNRMARYEEGLRDVRAVLRLAPADVDALNGASSLHQGLGQFDKALEYTQRALAIDADNADAWVNMARCHGHFGEFDKALEAASEALKLNPESIVGRVMRAQANAALQRLPAMKRDSEAALKATPVTAPDHVAQAYANLMLGRLGPAIASATQSLEIACDNGPALLVRAQAYGLLGRHEDSNADLQRSIRVRPGDPATLAMRAATYVALRRFDDAIRDASEALLIAPGNVIALANRAQAYWCLGRNEDAVRDAAAILKDQPNNYYASRMLEGAQAERRSPLKKLVFGALRRLLHS